MTTPAIHPPPHHTVIVTVPGGKLVGGRILPLSMLSPGTANITIETSVVLPCGEYWATYQTNSPERPPLGRGVFKVFNSVAYRDRWRASGVYTRPESRLRFLLVPT
jgi:hypothetical protein